MEQLEYHEAANIFPLMEGAAFEELKASIAQKGLKHSIVIADGKILDGRNRYRACCELEKKIKTKEWDKNGSPVGYVLTENLDRRHLSTGQKAMITADPLVFAYFQEEAEKRADEGRRRGGGDHRKPNGKTALVPIDTKPVDHPPTPPGLRGKASKVAGKAMNVSGMTVDRARKVHGKGSDELKAAVYSGAVAVSTAAKLAEHLPKSKQTELVNAGKKAVQKAAKAFAQPRGTKKKSVPELIKSILSGVEKLIKAVTGSSKGIAAQRKRAIDDLRQCSQRVKESSEFLT